MEALLALLTGLLGGFIYIWRENNKLKLENSIKKNEAQDIKMETLISELEKKRTETNKSFKRIEVKKADPNLSDKQIEDFWNKGNKH
jgi:hypothetical protein